MVGKDRPEECLANGGFIVSIQFITEIRCLQIRAATFRDYS